jgi:FAD/FMN-containing dehydrogenase
VAAADKQKEEFHSWRHHIPATISERREGLEAKGGGRVSGDWWVPKPHMLAVMKKTYEEVLPTGIEFTMYAHLGDGHPHTTFLCKDAAEKEKAHEIVMLQSRRAVELGGGVAGEHGIGKIKHELLAVQYPADIIEAMRRLKTSYDPKWLLGRGNIFAV